MIFRFWTFLVKITSLKLWCYSTLSIIFFDNFLVQYNVFCPGFVACGVEWPTRCSQSRCFTTSGGGWEQPAAKRPKANSSHVLLIKAYLIIAKVNTRLAAALLATNTPLCRGGHHHHHHIITLTWESTGALEHWGDNYQVMSTPPRPHRRQWGYDGTTLDPHNVTTVCPASPQLFTTVGSSPLIRCWYMPPPAQLTHNFVLMAADCLRGRRGDVRQGHRHTVQAVEQRTMSDWCLRYWCRQKMVWLLLWCCGVGANWDCRYWHNQAEVLVIVPSLHLATPHWADWGDR